MMLIDTSVLVPVFRDRSGERRDRLRRFLRGADFVLSRFTQIELLQGCASEPQWQLLSGYLEVQDYAEMTGDGWSEAARTHFELRRSGLTVRSILDCCIAQIAVQNKLTLVHNDRDFEAIARIRPIRLRRLDLL